MKEQVLTISQMQELIDMGVDVSNASMCWFDDGIRFKQLISCSNQDTIDDWTDQYGENCIRPAFTLHDILNILPNYVIVYAGEIDNEYKISVALGEPKNKYQERYHIEKSLSSLLEAAFNLLKWCKQNNYI